MEYKILEHPQRRLVGFSMQMSFNNIRTHELFQKLGPRLKDVLGRKGEEKFTVEIYPSASFFIEFNPSLSFDKWAAIELEDDVSVPQEFSELIVPAGRYAVFTYKGDHLGAAAAYRYIFSDWMHETNNALDDRPHLSVMGSKYIFNHVDSEEEIWIPIK